MQFSRYRGYGAMAPSGGCGPTMAWDGSKCVPSGVVVGRQYDAAGNVIADDPSARESSESTSFWSTLVNGITGVVSAFAPKPPPAPVYIQESKPMIPTWVWAVPLGATALFLGAKVLGGGKKSSMAGYSRRKRRSHRRR